MKIHSPSKVLRYRLDLVGKRFGRWCVRSYAGSRGVGVSMFLCRCDCGAKRIVVGSRLLIGKSKSCGCRGNSGRFKKGSRINLRHGECRRNKRTREYRTYVEMKKRCLNKNCSSYRYYGGRGIRICKRWLKSFENFLADMGRKPSRKHSIDRRNNDGNYTPKNCRWANSLQQRRNRRDSRR